MSSLKEKLQPVSFMWTGKMCRGSYSTSCTSSTMIKASILEELKDLYRKINSESRIKSSWLLNHNTDASLKCQSMKNLFSPAMYYFTDLLLFSVSIL